MSSKSKRTSTGSHTYSSNRKRRIRDLSVSSNEEQEDNQSKQMDSENEAQKKKKNTTHKSKKISSPKPDQNVESANDDAANDDVAKDDAANDDDKSEASEEEKEYEVETIKAHKYKGKVLQFLVGWKGYSSDDDSWEPAKHLTGALELLKKYKIEHDLDTKPKNSRASNVSAKSNSKRSEKKDESGASSAEEEDQTSRKRKRLSEDKPKSSIATLRKNGTNGPTKADRISAANRVSRQDSAKPGETSEDDENPPSVDEDEWHALHKGIASWENLVRSVRTIEKPAIEDTTENSPTSSKQIINVCLLWKNGKTTWVSNHVAREKLPQKLLDFYEAHLQFTTGEQETEN